MTAKCICSDKDQTFKTEINYKSDIFPQYKGSIIARCNNCNILKTLKTNESFNPEKSDASFYEKNAHVFLESFQPIVDQVNAYGKSSKVLDVGCSSGILIEILNSMGFDVCGIEPNKDAFAVAKKKLGVRVKKGYLKDNFGKFGQKFDIVIYNHVLEHIEDINEEFEIIKKILKKGGKLIIGVPNTNNTIFFMRRMYWESLKPDQHVWHFSSYYLRKYLKSKGFKINNIQYFDDPRGDYPFIKRIYFNFLTKINTLIKTGEAMLITSTLK